MAERDMPYYVYILENSANGRLYIGHTNNLERCVAEHNQRPVHKRRYTSRHSGHWTVRYSESHETRGAAMQRERYLKSGAGRTLKKPFFW